ncbi:uncharacterized protein F5Z01DRAFT_739866 [Emericellopsis atlantica]|uniref:Rhodopsin domain-containing protein n=1 Tax=Emericellopsis atlantica TaxID=2614577 RepID=A0A9P8CKZ7_9HYPO|nr:uncharacterized protein F5Z01DRAFT_739866 [Emericellopsis atlantica]KAG9250557.1 hypothetical protein F5Z01DRAFT_739866 [Emericellopsis atlantica]
MSTAGHEMNTDPARAAQSNLGWILGVNVAFHAIVIVFVALRVYTRVFGVKTFGKDDFLILIAIACALGGGMVTYIIAAQYGLGRHRDTIPKEDYKMYLKMTFIQALVSTIGSLLFLKLSIGFSLIRLSQQKVYTRVIWGFIVFVVLYSLVSWIEWFLVCKPLAGFWDKDLNPVCLPVKTHKAFALLNTSCNIFTDIAFATLPVPIIWVLQMAKKTRLYLIGVRLASVICKAVMVGILKTVCQNVFRGQYDQSFYNWIQFWGFLQINIGIIAARYGNGYGGSKNTGPRSQRNNRSNGWVKVDSGPDEYEMDDGRFGVHGGGYGDQIRTDIGVARVGSRSGSEEMIIQGVKGEEQKGIVRTTVVTLT